MKLSLLFINYYVILFHKIIEFLIVINKLFIKHYAPQYLQFCIFIFVY